MTDRTFVREAVLALFLILLPAQLISLNPEPPVQGGKVEIGYDAPNEDPEATFTLRITWSPSGDTEDIEVPNGGSVEVDVPSDATNILIEDLDGPSPDKSSAVEPS